MQYNNWGGVMHVLGRRSTLPFPLGLAGRRSGLLALALPLLNVGRARLARLALARHR